MTAHFVNRQYFDDSPVHGAPAANQPKRVRQQTYLDARGFDAMGYRVGGIVKPAEVDLPAGTILFRLYGDKAQWDGRWWVTPFELSQIIDHFGHHDVRAGRRDGKGMLHASLAVLAQEWRNSMRHFCVVELAGAFKAFYGEGDHALLGSEHGRKVALLRDQRTGTQKAARQLFLPGLRDFTADVTVHVQRGMTDSALASNLRRFRRAPLYFEV